jgi:diguanylate cyclase (GGDEF)-like protein
MQNTQSKSLDADVSRIYDPLTGALARVQLAQYLRHITSSALEKGRPFSLLMLDLDHFKSVNDAFGYARGDQVLVEFTTRLSDLIQNDDLIFRYGGDEFIIILPDTDKSRAVKLAYDLLHTIESVTFSGDPAIQLSMSIGVASCPQDGLTPEVLFEAADQYHYEAKRRGRSQVIDEIPVQQETTLPVEPPVLIERETAFQHIEDFLAQISLDTRGVCQVHGPEGAGKTRLLMETARSVRLLGYQVLMISGSPARRARLYGALQEGARAFENLPDPQAGEKQFLRALNLALVEREALGLMVLVDNLAEIDPTTLEFLQHWEKQLKTPALCFMIAVPEGSQLAFLPKKHIPHLHIRLSPLSPAGVEQWLTSTLGTAPLPPLLEWFYSETEGWPGAIQAAQTLLYEQDLLVRNGEKWEITPEVQEYPLHTWLAERRKNPRTNLSFNLAELVGRQDALAAIIPGLQQHPIYLLTGPGGIGKTRLAQQIGLEMLDQFTDGVFMVPLERQSDSRGLVIAIADALELHFHGQGSMEDQLFRYLRNKDLLLILDNPANADDLFTFLLRLVEIAPSVKVILATREKLGFTAGEVYEVSGFKCFEPDPLADTVSDAERLFIHTARRILPNFQVHNDERNALRRICRLLDGMPLAIELAATWVSSYSLAEIEQEIDSNLAFLTTQRQDVDARHRSLTAVFDYFWNMLSTAEQKTLSRLAVFHGAFTEPAARFVAGASPFFLDALAGRSYLRAINHEFYEMHALLRRYALEKLRGNAELYHLTRELHCQYFLDEIRERHAAFVKGIVPPEQLMIERDNYRLAWKWALENMLLTQIYDSLGGYHSYLHLTGNFKEGQLIFQDAIERVESLSGVTPEDGALLQKLTCTLHLRLSSFLNKLGVFNEATRAAKKSVELARISGLKQVEAAGLLEWGESLRHQGDYVTALALLNNALELARQENRSILVVDCLYALGAVAHYQTNLEQNRLYAEEALAISLSNADLRGQSRAYNLLAIATEMEGKYSLAKAYYERSIQISQQTGDRLSASIPLINLASLLQFLGNYPAARRVYEEFLAIKQDLSDRPGEVWGLIYLSLLFHQLGNQSVAENYARQGLALAIEIGDRHNQATALTNLGHALLAQRAFEPASEVYRQALALRQELSQETLAMESLAGLARTSLRSGNPQKAIDYVEKILEFVEDKPLDGTDEPFRVWLVCYQVLEANHDPRAGKVIQRGYNLLMERANQIQDDELRESFLGNVRAHRALISAWQAYNPVS